MRAAFFHNGLLIRSEEVHDIPRVGALYSRVGALREDKIICEVTDIRNEPKDIGEVKTDFLCILRDP